MKYVVSSMLFAVCCVWYLVYSVPFEVCTMRQCEFKDIKFSQVRTKIKALG